MLKDVKRRRTRRGVTGAERRGGRRGGGRRKGGRENTFPFPGSLWVRLGPLFCLPTWLSVAVFQKVRFKSLVY